MDYLWSPVRYIYVSSASPADSTSGQDSCLFCRVACESNDAPNYVVLRADRNLILLNRYPYTTGHLMIAPYAHVATLEEAEVATLEEIMRLAQRAEKALRAV